MGYVVRWANPASFLQVEEVVDYVQHLIHSPENVNVGPAVLVRAGHGW